MPNLLPHCALACGCCGYVMDRWDLSSVEILRVDRLGILVDSTPFKASLIFLKPTCSESILMREAASLSHLLSSLPLS